MKKVLLLTALLVAFVSTSAFGLTLEKSADGNTLTVDGVEFARAQVGAAADQTNTRVVATIYVNATGDKAIMTFSLTETSRPYAALTLHKQGAFEDFNCDGTWNSFDPNSTPHIVPDCAK